MKHFFEIAMVLFSLFMMTRPGEASFQKSTEIRSSHNEREAISFTISYVYREAGKGEFLPFQNGSLLHSGDHYKVIFTPTEECYVYIFQIDSANNLYRLFPMERFGGVVVNNLNPAQAGKTYYIPAKEKSFVLDAHTGIEKIYIVAARERDAGFERASGTNPSSCENELEEQLQQLDRLLESAMQIDEAVEAEAAQEDSASITWQEGGQTFSAVQQRLENMCDGCVYVLTFEHQ